MSHLHQLPGCPLLIRLTRYARAQPSFSLRRTTIRSASSASSSPSVEPISPSPAVGVEAAGEETATPPTRLQFVKLYKELHRLGRDYPDPKYEFNKRLRRAFEKNAPKNASDPAAARRNLELGERVKKEVLALISLKKYRHLRRSYYAGDAPR